MTSIQHPRSSRRHFSRTMFHGSINFEQQKKRAKELLKALKNKEGSAQKRLTKTHPEVIALSAGNTRLKLADCQLVIARENGFSSWPELKIHCDRLTLRKKQILSGSIPQIDDRNTLHIRCGWDIKHGLEIAGFQGEFHEFSDPFCQGPISELNPDLNLELKPDLNSKLKKEYFRQQRAAFISKAYGMPIKEVLTKQRHAYEKLEYLHDYDRVVLWFEHDSYDQLILSYLLKHISEMKSRPSIELICVDEVPGVPDFTGLGQLAPEMLIWLWENRRNTLTAPQIDLGQRVWKALCHKTPVALRLIIAQGTTEIPPMAAALERHLQELPSKQNGLGLTQQLTLEIIAEHHQIKGSKLFSILMREREPLPFLGDLMYWHVLVELVKATVPLISYEMETPPRPWPERILSLTDTGKKVLAGDLNYFDLTQSDRWVGGIKVSPNIDYQLIDP